MNPITPTLATSTMRTLLQTFSAAALISPFVDARYNRNKYGGYSNHQLQKNYVEEEDLMHMRLPKKYEEFAKAMAHFGYGWEAYQVTTKDGF